MYAVLIFSFIPTSTSYFLLFFHLFSFQTLIQYLELFEVSVTLEELKEPTEALLTGIYGYFLSLMMGFNRDDIRGLPYHTLNEVNNPELYSEFHQIVFLKNLFQFMAALGVTGFNMRDIVAPDPTRTRRALSAIMNYAKFNEDLMIQYEAKSSDLVSHYNMKFELEDTVNSREAELNRIRKDRAEFEPKISELQSDLTSLQTSFEMYDKQQNSLRQLIRSHKNELQLLKDTQESEKAQFEEVKATVENLRASIVSSPAKMRRTIYDLDVGVSRTRKEVGQLQKDIRMLNARLHGLTNAESELQELDPELKICETELQKLTVQLAKSKKIQEPVELLKEENLQLEKQEQEIILEASRLEEKMYKMEKDYEKKKIDMKMSKQDVCRY